MDVASECLNKCAAPRLGRATPARRNALSTICETAEEEKAQNGARQRTNKRISVGSWPTFLQIGHNRRTDFLGQRQSRVATALTTNMNPGTLPIDVTQAEVHDIARPKAKTGQQQQDRPIPPFNG
jgi:hypothetical protein